VGFQSRSNHASVPPVFDGAGGGGNPTPTQASGQASDFQSFSSLAGLGPAQIAFLRIRNTVLARRLRSPTRTHRTRDHSFIGNRKFSNKGKKESGRDSDTVKIQHGSAAMKLVRFRTVNSSNPCFGVVVRDQAVPFAVLLEKAGQSSPQLSDSRSYLAGVHRSSQTRLPDRLRHNPRLYRLRLRRFRRPWHRDSDHLRKTWDAPLPFRRTICEAASKSMADTRAVTEVPPIASSPRSGTPSRINTKQK
jgi:hypothetical protein